MQLCEQYLLVEGASVVVVVLARLSSVLPSPVARHTMILNGA